MKTPDELEKLSLLLDDEDDNVAINVIAALLDRQDELGDLPARLQESSNELVRKRAHQLQAAITFRKRRQDFAALLEAENPDFYAGLVLLHMLWFDRDSQVNVRADLEKFIAESRRTPPVSLDDARAFMCRKGFAAELESTIHPENYCIGTILYQRSGAASLLMGLLKNLMAEPENSTLSASAANLPFMMGKIPFCSVRGTGGSAGSHAPVIWNIFPAGIYLTAPEICCFPAQ